MAAVPSAEASRIYSFEAEQAVLGSILIDPKCLSVAAMLIRADYFYYAQHKEIFAVMQELDASSGAIDLLIVLEQLKKRKVFDTEDGGKQYLLQLSDAVPSTANVACFAPGVLADTLASVLSSHIFTVPEALPSMYTK